MNKKFIGFLLSIPLSFSIISCEGNSSEPDVDPVPEDKTVDLSAAGMANCYIVQSEGEYKFKADNQFNLGAGLPVPPEIHPVGAGLIWQSGPDLISDIALTEEDGTPYIEFEVLNARGNALIAALDDEGEIVWSWHIWMPESEITAIPTATGYEIMNLNLGALNDHAGDAESYGMLYQWGRKDPFPASATLTGDQTTLSAPVYDIENAPLAFSNSSWGSMADNTIEYSVAHPLTVLSNYSQFATSRDWLKASLSDDSLWGNPEGDYRDSETNLFPNKGRKTCYDPSPAGWRVPPADVFRNFTTTGGYAWDFVDFNVKDVNGDGIIDLNDYNYGWVFNVSDKAASYFPAAARFDGSFAMLMGSMSGLWGNYWSNAPYSGMAGGAFSALSFQIKSQTGQEMITASPSAGASRADAFSIRCIRE